MKVPLQPDCFYHLFNHANGNDNLFRSKENYQYFLRQYKKYILEITNTYAYCLMPNHFHIVLRVNTKEELETYFETKNKIKRQSSSSSKPMESLVSYQFGHFFNSYTQAFNRTHSRKGSLFAHNFQKREITNDDYLRKVIHYVHYNPIRHGFRTNISAWKFCSYKALTSQSPTLLERYAVMELFGGLENFIYCHKHPPDSTGIN